MERSVLIRQRLKECIHKGEINHKDLVHIFEYIGDVLNLQTLSNYAKSEGISYNGAKKRKLESIKIDNIKFIIQ